MVAITPVKMGMSVLGLCILLLLLAVGALCFRPLRLHSGLVLSPRRLTQTAKLGVTAAGDADANNAIVDDFANVDINSLAPAEAYEKLRVILKGTCVYFVGMMGSGKSTLGEAFAQSLGYRFLDTDEIAEFMIEMPISDYFSKGEEQIAKFRELEQQILQELSQYTRVTIATGGGIVERNENWGYLRHGIVVFVKMTPEDIFKRLSTNPGELDKRPLLRNSADPLEKLRELQKKREDKYMLADVVVNIDSNSSPSDITEQTAKEILQFIKNNPPLWRTWSKKRNNIALEAAAMQNPAAASTMGFAEGVPRGKVEYVSLQDIEVKQTNRPHHITPIHPHAILSYAHRSPQPAPPQSGKIKLPTGPPPSQKGFDPKK